MKAGQRELSGFERRLLDELRQTIVADRPSPAAPPATRAGILRPGWGWSRRLALAGSIAVLAAFALTVGLPFVDGRSGPPSSRAAYAVTANDRGTVTIEINALRDAKGLERRLRRAGVPAVVRYLPPGNSCSEEASTLVGPAPLPAAIETSEDGSVRFEIDRDVLRPSERLFIYSREPASEQQPASSIGISIVDDKFAGCSG
jgi:hypothetical protein